MTNIPTCCNSSDSNSDENIEFLNYINRQLEKEIRKPNLLTTRIDHISKWDDHNLFYKVSSYKKTITILLKMIQDQITTFTER